MICVAVCDMEKCVWNLWDRGTRCFNCWLWIASTLLIKRNANLSYSWIFNFDNELPTEKVAFATSIGRMSSPSGLDIWKVVTWLILPVVICLSQRLSHACLSINKFVLWNCEWLIKSVIVYLMLPCYMDNCGNSRANTCNPSPDLRRGVFIR